MLRRGSFFPQQQVGHTAWEEDRGQRHAGNSKECQCRHAIRYQEQDGILSQDKWEAKERKQCPASRYIHLSLSSWLAARSCPESSSQPCVLVSTCPLGWPFKTDCSLFLKRPVQALPVQHIKWDLSTTVLNWSTPFFHFSYPHRRESPPHESSLFSSDWAVNLTALNIIISLCWYVYQAFPALISPWKSA